MPIGAILGATAVGVGGSVIAADKNKDAIQYSTVTSIQAQREALAAQEKQAAETRAMLTDQFNESLGYQQSAFNTSGKLQTDIYNQNIGILNPYNQTGYAAMNSINSMLGLPTQQAYSPTQIAFTPISVPTTTTTVPTTPAPQTPAPTSQVNGALVPAIQNNMGAYR